MHAPSRTHNTGAAAIEIIADPDRASVILDPFRLRLMNLLREGPDSAAGLARHVGEQRQKVNYHLRELEKAGFLELQEERRRGNCMERLLKVTARHYLIDPNALGELAADPEFSRDRFSAAYLAAVSARAIRDLAFLRVKAEKEGKRLATVAVETEARFATPADFQAFQADLTEAVAGVIARHYNERAPAGRRFRLFLGLYPARSGEGRRQEKRREHQKWRST
jgi:DNA-binding transcriptional ArsR family regulator